LRIAGADINGIDAAGIHIALLKLDPAATYTYAPILQVGNSSAVAELKLAGNANGATLSYRQANVSQANIIGYNQAIYFDSETYLFRNLVGDTLRLSLNGTEANFRVPVRTNSFRNFDGVTTLTFLLNGTNQYFATTHSFYSFNGSVAFANIDASGLTLNQPAAVLSVGGVPGIGMRLYKAGLSAIYTVHQVGGQTQWYDAPGTTHLMTLTSPGKLTANGGFTFPTGTPQNASIQLTGYPDTGFYYSAAGTLEMGTTLATSARSCVRAHYGASKVDIMSGDTVIAVFGPYPAVRFAAHVSPASANTYYCAEPTLSWYTVYTQVAPQITSDIRMKNEHGPITDVLDMVDSIQPFIASFKKELQPVENKYPYWDKKFPSFSAQDILAKIDGKLGTRIVNAELETLSMTNDYLMPIMWQAIRELYARLRVLEGN
jgi:hypothetical protein